MAEEVGFEPTHRINDDALAGRCDTIMRFLRMDALTGLEPALIGLQPIASPSWLQCVIQTILRCTHCCLRRTYAQSERLNRIPEAH